jgi:hypothetical protein
MAEVACCAAIFAAFIADMIASNCGFSVGMGIPAARKNASTSRGI